ncbi:hypothetical protein [Candidatus Poriferisocius sp.]|uniref:hypothetical protein n=1 Tax=Candidatus Poriferisocius sp. TaxID=3101276 RepID=UPI003B52B21B
MSPNRKLAAAIAAVCMVLSGLAAAVPTAAAAGSLVEEIEVRDRLIADQEALLNAYRCMFTVDVAAVPGGCANGAPAQPAGEPGPPPPNPTKADKDARDNLIAAQENLLNTYRCNHNIDTQLVPSGCKTTPELGDDIPVDDTSEAPEDDTETNQQSDDDGSDSGSDDGCSHLGDGWTMVPSTGQCAPPQISVCLPGEVLVEENGQTVCRYSDSDENDS